MITTKRTAALIAAMSLLGTVAPAAFAQVGDINEDDDIFAQSNAAFEAHCAFSVAATSNTGNQAGGNVESSNVQELTSISTTMLMTSRMLSKLELTSTHYLVQHSSADEANT